MRLTPKIAAAGAGVALALAFTAFRPPSTPGPPERDFEAYYAAGATVNAGEDPYSREVWTVERNIPGVGAQRDELLPFVGPAAALPFWALLARLPYRGALVVWTALLIAALLGVLAAALRLARAPRDPWTVANAAAATIASAPIIGALALGQAALVSAAGVGGALVAFRARRPAAAFAATLLAAVQPNLALVLTARIRSRWDAVIAASAAATFAGLTLAAGGGLSGLGSYMRRLSAHSAAERIVTIQHTPAAIAYSFGLAPDAAAGFGVAIAVAAAVLATGLIVRERLDATTASLLTCALLPLAIPFFHEHDFALELLPVLVLAIRARGRAHGLASVAAVLLLIDWFGLAQRHGAAGQIVCLGCAVALGVAGLNRRMAVRQSGTDFWGVAALVLVAALAVPLAKAKPAPTWPDMLPAAYRADPGADASGVWAAEQRAAGLTAREPAWGLLRGLPLVGCLVLSAALVADARGRRRIPVLGDEFRRTRGPRRRRVRTREPQITRASN
jgi:hypothetical protein